MRYAKVLALIPVLLLCALPVVSRAQVDVGVSVNFAPPEIPEYDQPPLPAPGYLWTPGYWAWDGSDYYWVPGTWVLPPVNGMLWTPGYWGWRDGFYLWNAGYWGPEVGYYGGIDYGYGYTGRGFQGGYWHGGAFFYNRSVANFGRVNIVNVYSAPARHWGGSRVSFNGGHGGVRLQPNEHERAFMNQRHNSFTNEQREHQDQARGMRELRASANGGRPRILTTQRPADFSHPGPGLHDDHAGGRPEGAGVQSPSVNTNHDNAIRGGDRGRSGPEPQRLQPRDQVQRQPAPQVQHQPNQQIQRAPSQQFQHQPGVPMQHAPNAPVQHREPSARPQNPGQQQGQHAAQHEAPREGNREQGRREPPHNR